ncbi:WG repeat-containing protein [Chitinophaga sp. Mgbs1]|uniref:WG repeat-containing protein n=1 Tax=Chitinophaga solisilvae TaxID=1233460 RepID=A0A433WED3_9BACT|nr:WG repeat-containing protein [Chitinophaga solisilvae]
MGEAFSREGKFLYYPQLYDNGPDYYAEGLQRFVENDKIGFADKSGRKVIPAQWSFATPFNYGYAAVYTGSWKRVFEAGGEHWSIVADSGQGTTWLITHHGEKVMPLSAQQHPGDYYYDGKYYPYPFSYTAAEGQIVSYFRQLPLLQLIHKVNYADDPGNLQFEITEKPSALHPWYVVQGYLRQQQEDRFVFLVSRDGKKIYHAPFAGEKQQPLQRWIMAELQSCREYLREHPDAPFSFDVNKYAKEWQHRR